MKTFREKPLRKASAKAQSAMEYLMTYGWAILIVAVVLGALYSLGVFNGAAFLGTSCIAASGFYCTNPTLSTGGVLTVTIGQATGTTFKNAYLYFVPSGTNFSTSDPSTSIGTLNSGQQVTASIPLGVGSPYPAAYTLGTSLSGYLYLQFTDIYGTTEVNKIATVLTKVTASSSGAIASIPSGIVAYVPITLTNSQSSATPSPFQQMINITESTFGNYIAYNNNFANFEYFYANGTIIPAWIESNSSGKLITWVKLTPSIPANSELTIYLGFASKTTNLLSSSGTSGIGEAPQLSSTYAQYDDGASVFYIYANGDTPSSSFTTDYASISQVSTTLPNGATGPALSISSASSSTYISYAGFSKNGFTTSYIMQGWIKATQTGYIVGVGGELSSTNGGQGYLFGAGTGAGDTYVSITKVSGTATFTTLASTGTNTANWEYFMAVYNSGSMSMSGSSSIGGTWTTVSATDTSYTGNIVGLAVSDSSAASNLAYFAYFFVRAYPPNGVMPSVSFSGLSTA